MVKLFLIQSFTLDYFLLAGCALVSRVDVSYLDAALESCVQVEHDLIQSEQLANLRLCLDDDVEVAWFSESSFLGIVHYRLDGLDGNLFPSLIYDWQSLLGRCLFVVVLFGFLPGFPRFTYHKLQPCHLAGYFLVCVGQSLFPLLLQ